MTHQIKKIGNAGRFISIEKQKTKFKIGSKIEEELVHIVVESIAIVFGCEPSIEIYCSHIFMSHDESNVAS